MSPELKTAVMLYGPVWPEYGSVITEWGKFMPDPTTTALTASQHCAAVASLTLDLNVATALMENYLAAGDASGAEGCKQTIRKCVEAVAEHLQFFHEMAKPQETK